MIKYYKLFDLMYRTGYTKNDLRKIISANTVAKLSKGENVTTDIIDRICEFFNCQPGDIMEYTQIMTRGDTGKEEEVADNTFWAKVPEERRPDPVAGAIKSYGEIEDNS